MNKKQALGYFLLSLPFISIMVLSLYQREFQLTLALFGTLIAVLLCIYFGTRLIDSKDK